MFFQRSKFRHAGDPSKKNRLSYAIEKRASKMFQKASAAVENSMGYGSRKAG